MIGAMTPKDISASLNMRKDNYKMLPLLSVSQLQKKKECKTPNTIL